MDQRKHPHLCSGFLEESLNFIAGSNSGPTSVTLSAGWTPTIRVPLSLALGKTACRAPSFQFPFVVFSCVCVFWFDSYLLSSVYISDDAPGLPKLLVLCR